jgi:hypothetical protein
MIRDGDIEDAKTIAGVMIAAPRFIDSLHF